MLYQGIIGGGSSPVEDLSPVLLWTNPSPTSNFAAQTVSLNLTEYAGVIIEYNLSTEDLFPISRIYVKKNDNLYQKPPYYFGCGSGADKAISRGVSQINDEGIAFLDEITGLSDHNSNLLIPSKIYGVKEYVVEPVVGDLLWTNPNPTSVLANTEISGNYSKYKSILVKARANITVDFRSEFNIAKSSSSYAGGICFTNFGVGDYYRNIQFTNEKITIQSGHYMTGGTDSAADNAAIPLEIYGIE